jgi:uncharacterized membrane protein YdbT with pleckstrin-like domain
MRRGRGERVRVETRRHGIVLMRPFARSVALALLGAVLLSLRWPLPVAGAVLVAVAALLALSAVWRWDRTRLVVTSEKVVLEQGLLLRSSCAVLLGSLGAFALEQSILGRLFGYGTLVVGPLRVRYAPDPRRLSGVLEELCSARGA